MVQVIQHTVLHLALIIGLVACASQGKMKFSSDPEGADVYVVEENGSERKLGATPLEVTGEDFKFSEQQVLDIRFKKSGFVSERVVVDSQSFDRSIDMHLKMKSVVSWHEAYQDPKASPYLADIASLAAEIQSAVMAKDFTNAEKLARVMISRYPHVSVGWTLMGNIYYIRKDVGQAIQAYRKALEIDPENNATKEVLSRLEGGV